MQLNSYWPSLVGAIVVGFGLLLNNSNGDSLPQNHFEQEEGSVVSQFDLSKEHRDFACGPTSIYNWLAHGDDELQAIASKFAKEKTREETVEYIIEQYASRGSLFDKRKPRYNLQPPYSGTGPINQMITAQEILAEHAPSKRNLSGQFLHRLPSESTAEHIERVAKLFSGSIDSGVPVLVHLRGYRLNPKKSQKKQVMGHHVVISEIEFKDGEARITCLEPSGGTVKKGWLRIAQQEFAAPTYEWNLRNGRASQTSQLTKGRPHLQIDMPGYPKAFRSGKIVVPNFATFAIPKED